MIICSRFMSIAIVCFMCYNQVIGISKPKDKKDVLQEKIRQLSDWTNQRTVIKLDNGKFNSHVKGTPRNYSIIMMLTTLHSQRQCQMCRQAMDEFTVVANSWRYGKNFVDGLVFFTVADYDDTPDIFTSLKINTVPQIVHFPPKGKQKRVETETMDIYRIGFSAEAIVRFVSEKIGLQVLVVRPPDYFGNAIYLLPVLCLGVFVYFKRENLDYLYNKSSWAAMALVTMMLLTSGQMWNHIRGAQFMERDPQSGTSIYIHPWSDSQVVAESYIIFGLNLAVVSGFILLNEARIMKATVGKKRVVALSALGAIVFFFSLLLSIFKSKHQGYPYSFLLR